MNRYAGTRSTRAAPIIALVTLLLLSPFALAESDAIGTMAKMVSGMNHFPSDEQKETLAGISRDDSNSEATRTIADAIHDIEHKATSEDVAALKAITGDSSASEAEKALADVVIDFHHKAGAEAKETLEALAQQ